LVAMIGGIVLSGKKMDVSLSEQNDKEQDIQKIKDTI